VGRVSERPNLTLALPPELVDAVAERVAELLEERRPSETEPYLDVAGAAGFLACPTSRVYALASARRIPCHRDGSRLLFRREELRRWVEEQGGGKRP